MKASDKNNDRNVIFRMFFQIAKKHAGAIGIYIFIFLMLTFWISGVQQKSETAMFSADQLKVCIEDQDRTPASSALSDYLASRHHIIAAADDPQITEDNLYYRYVDYVLTIPKGFSQKLQNGSTENLVSVQTVPGSTNSRFIDEQISQYIKALQMYLAGGQTQAQAIQSTETSLAALSSPAVMTFSSNVSDINVSFYYYMRYLPYVLLNTIILGVGIVLTIFRKKDFSDRIRCSAISGRSFERQMILASITFSVAVWAFFLAVGFCIYRSSMLGLKPAIGILNTFLFTIVSLSIAYLSCSLSTGTKTGTSTVSMFANVISLGMAFLCGIFVNQSLLGPQVLTVAHFLPAYWYIRLNDRLMNLSTNAIDFHEVILCFGIEILFIIANLSLAGTVDQKIRQRL
ncbi:MAG: ABC transporter permease [Butyrivibrio sp.]|jgi:ABC-2 type transport system permease protein|nr:ABC transporter permease [Butyrivibrio sp.]